MRSSSLNFLGREVIGNLGLQKLDLTVGPSGFFLQISGGMFSCCKSILASFSFFFIYFPFISRYL